MTDPAVETLVRAFHDTAESLAPSFGWITRVETRSLDLSSPTGRLMCAVIQAVRLPALEAARWETWQAAATFVTPSAPSSELLESHTLLENLRDEFTRRAGGTTDA